MPLSNCQIEHFIENGYTFMRGAIPRAFITSRWGPREDFLKSYQDTDHKGHLYFPVIAPRWEVKEVAPALDKAISHLIGEDNSVHRPRAWGDGFVVAMPKSDANDHREDGRANQYRWHKDGFHRHFLDSPEIGIIVLIMWSRFTEHNGATAIANDSVKSVATLLLRHPEGLDGDFFDTNQLANESNFTEVRAIGDPGDVCLIHPMLLHALRPNLSNDFRASTNPVVSLSKPMTFKRPDGRYSPVERSVLHALDATSLDFAPRGDRGTSIKTSLAGELEAMRSALRYQIEAHAVSRGSLLTSG